MLYTETVLPVIEWFLQRILY